MCAFLSVPGCSTDRQPRTGSPLPPAAAAPQHLGSPGELAAPPGARTQHIPGRWRVCGPLVHTPALNLVLLPGSQLQVLPCRTSCADGRAQRAELRVPRPMGKANGGYLCTHPNTQMSHEGRGCSHRRETHGQPASVSTQLCHQPQRDVVALSHNQMCCSLVADGKNGPSLTLPLSPCL